MADTIHVPDIEQAEEHLIPPTDPNEEATFPETEAEAHFQDIKRVETQKVIVLSFRSLQLRRVAELQDELLRLAVKTVDTSSSSDNSNVEKVLRDHGKRS